ncbi:hypothetical protein [Larkinella arboricola]|nr:hypothetical protein [Larkinella arboricola]
MKDKNEVRLRAMAERIRKTSETPTVHMVVPVARSESEQVSESKTVARTTSEKVKESQLNVQIQVDLIDRLKIHGIRTKKSMKQLVTEALSMFLAEAEHNASSGKL